MAKLRIAKSIDEITAAAQDFKVFKACHVRYRKIGPDGVTRRIGKGVRRKVVIVTMRLPKEAHRNTFGRATRKGFKMRASKCEVLSIKTIAYELLPAAQVACSSHEPTFAYEVGAMVRPRTRFSKTLNVCASGIHFFRTRKEAVRYFT